MWCALLRLEHDDLFQRSTLQLWCLSRGINGRLIMNVDHLGDPCLVPVFGVCYDRNAINLQKETTK